MYTKPIPFIVINEHSMTARWEILTIDQAKILDQNYTYNMHIHTNGKDTIASIDSNNIVLFIPEYD